MVLANEFCVFTQGYLETYHVVLIACQCVHCSLELTKAWKMNFIMYIIAF